MPEEDLSKLTDEQLNFRLQTVLGYDDAARWPFSSFPESIARVEDDLDLKEYIIYQKNLGRTGLQWQFHPPLRRRLEGLVKTLEETRG